MRAAALPFQPPPADPAAALYDTCFCVVDLETTGGSRVAGRITEVGAVKVRGGLVLGEFQTLVDPGTPIPAAVSAVTGINARMVDGQPPIAAVVPAFLEFAAGTVLVAHNAPFDTGFLAANLERLGYPPLDHPVVCTVALARRLVRDEVRDLRLASLAARFGARTTPVHRALPDARATVDVLHGLLERAGSFGATTLAGLLELLHAPPPGLRRPRRRAATARTPRARGPRPVASLR